ncbi:hypothetical protein GCM10010230_28450 [Streptomyces narbonensis]|nr:hypothetical protein GCM10010230_28450 [Streptomyces narbonensis]
MSPAHMKASTAVSARSTPDPCMRPPEVSFRKVGTLPSGADREGPAGIHEGPAGIHEGSKGDEPARIRPP